MMDSLGYIFTKSEWEIYHNFKPSIFQRIFWLFWPSMVYINWLRYRDFEWEDWMN